MSASDRPVAPPVDSPVASPPAPARGLPKAERLRKRFEFLDVQGRGRKYNGDHFMVFVLAPPPPSDGGAPPGARRPTRFGVTVSKKVGVAVVRNRVKRLARELFRRHKPWFPEGRDLVFVARRSAADASYEALCT